MVSNSEIKLFCQSALAMVGFLMVLSLIGWIYQPKTAAIPSAVVVSELHQ